MLAGRGDVAGDASGDGVDRGPADHRFGYGRVAFVVPRQAAVSGQQGESPLDRPPARNHREPALPGGFAGSSILTGQPEVGTRAARLNLGGP
jgi:hypothetical protein